MEKYLFFIKRFIPKKIFASLQPVYHFLLSWLAAIWYRFPSDKLIVIGITGTTGKTSSVYLIAEVFAKAGYKIGYTSTAMFSDGEKQWLNDKKMTMTGRFFTQKMLSRMVKNNCHYAIIETTSQGIVQFRHRFINYDILIFTGLYPEHIEAHGSWENYKQAKAKLFFHLKSCKTKYADEKKQVKKTQSGLQKIGLNRVKKFIVANGDSEQAEEFLSFWAEEKYQFRITNYPSRDKRSGAGELRIKNKNQDDIKTIEASNVMSDDKGVSFEVNGLKIFLNLLGEFNVANAMNAVCLGMSQGINLEKIKFGLENIKSLPGRLEKINLGQPFVVIVDYAFEPEAVKKLYQTVDLISHKKIIHVLGSAGGGRDIARRSKLGDLAGRKADIVIVTNEDPYDDDPQIIIDQVADGAEQAGKKLNKNLFKILDREVAINQALKLAQENDLVLITGKGSEQAICLAGGKKIPWDDRQAVRQELIRLNITSAVDK